MRQALSELQARIVDGPFFAPTMLVDATPAMRCMREETFGPLLAVCQLLEPRLPPLLRRARPQRPVRVRSHDMAREAECCLQMQRGHWEGAAAKLDAGSALPKVVGKDGRVKGRRHEADMQRGRAGRSSACEEVAQSEHQEVTLDGALVYLQIAHTHSMDGGEIVGESVRTHAYI